MIKIITILLLFISTNCFATNYYVANSGNDSNNGLATGTAWKTIAKINGFTFSSGDSVFLNKGDTWNERLIIPSSHLNFSSYGTGNKPLVTGFQLLTGFSNIGGNIWKTTASNAVDSLNTVLIDGLIRAKCRYPNSGYLTITSRTSDSSLTGSLSGTPNYTGAECVVRTTPWVTDVVHISSQSSGTLNFTPQHLTYASSFGSNSYFIQNSQYALDVQYEWFSSDTAKNFMVYSVTSPVVYVSTIDTLVWLNNKSNISFTGINFTGANKATFQIDTCNTVLIQNCTVNNCGRIGVSALKSPHISIINDSIQNCLSGSIYLRQVDPYTPTVNTCDTSVVSGNYIKNSAIFPGMGMSDNGRYNAIETIGLNTTINNNTIDSTGYIGIQFNGKNSIVKNNYVTNFCLIKDDGGGIYVVNGAYLSGDYNDNSLIRSNIVMYGYGYVPGVEVNGIYLDDGTRYITVDSNTVAYCGYRGMYFHNNANITARDNTIFDNLIYGFNVRPETSANQYLVFTKNKLYSNIDTKLFNQTYNIPTSYFLGSDSNYISQPINENDLFYYYNTYYSLSAWQAFISDDAHSLGTPTGITAANAILKDNPSSSAQSFSLTGTYYDITGAAFTNSITLQPFQSSILFKAITDIIISVKYNLKLRRIISK